MATNGLTPEQDLLTRAFYTEVLSDETLLLDNPVVRGKGFALCRLLLNYDVIDGCHVAADVQRTHKFGVPIEVVDEWADDTRRAHDAANKDTSTRKAGRRKSTKSTPVRKAVLPEDV